MDGNLMPGGDVLPGPDLAPVHGDQVSGPDAPDGDGHVVALAELQHLPG
jgi:hypothetical protein